MTFAAGNTPPTAGEVMHMLHNRVVEVGTWEHQYSHVAGMDRTGSLALRDGRTLRWMLRPGVSAR